MSAKKVGREAGVVRKAPTPDLRLQPDAAFDLWLERSLRALYDEVAKEPIPEELRKLIEDDRKS